MWISSFWKWVKVGVRRVDKERAKEDDGECSKCKRAGSKRVRKETDRKSHINSGRDKNN
jgi:hypothetical protein